MVSAGNLRGKDNDWSQKITNIRALAIVIVVLGHSIILYSTKWTLYATTVTSPFLDWVKAVIDLVQMPLFFSLSGFLFLHSHAKKRGFLNLVKSKAIRLLLPYFIVGFAYMVPIKLAVGYPGYRNKTFVDILFSFLKVNDVGHLWFLPALFLIFLISEVLLTIIGHMTRNNKASAMIYFIAAVMLYFEGYRIGFGYGPLLSAFHYLLWFALGYLISANWDLLTETFKKRSTAIFISATAIVLLIYCSKWNTHTSIELICQILNIVALYGVMPVKQHTMISRLSKDSFGIYLFHSPLVYFTYTFLRNANPIIVVMINIIVFGACAWGLTELVRKAHIGIVIGEK